MVKIKDVVGFLESIASPQLQASYDNAGLIVGNPTEEVRGVLVCLDSIEEVVEEAISNGCNLIVAHHPILFKGIKKINGKNYVERTLIKAIKNDVGIYAIHTNLDSVKHGVNAKIAEKLGVQNCRVLEPERDGLNKLTTFIPLSHVEKVRESLFASGAGEIGGYSNCSFSSDGYGTFKGGESTQAFVGKKGELHTEREARLEVLVPNHVINGVVGALLESHPYEEVAYDIYPLKNSNQDIGYGMIGELSESVEPMTFLRSIKEKMRAYGVRFTKIPDRPIKTVAFCGGSGSFLLSAAKRNKADIFITGDFKYHEFFDAENQLIIADIGHYESEQYTSELLADYLKQKFSTFAIRISEINTNPVNYL